MSAQNLKADWANLSLERRRAVLGALVAEIVVLPSQTRGPIPDPDRFQVAWRA